LMHSPGSVWDFRGAHRAACHEHAALNANIFG
jgi:hypothetical protein